MPLTSGSSSTTRSLPHDRPGTAAVRTDSAVPSFVTTVVVLSRHCHHRPCHLA